MPASAHRASHSDSSGHVLQVAVAAEVKFVTMKQPTLSEVLLDIASTN